MVIEFRNINPRISTITIKTDNIDVALINVHPSTEEKYEDEKKLFYETLVDVFASSASSVKTMLGNFNAKSGQRCYNAIEMWLEITRKYE